MLKLIKNLVKGQQITFRYNDRGYHLEIHSVNDIGEREMNVQATEGIHSMFGTGMNVSYATKQYLSLYDYNMFDVISKIKLPMEHITDVKLVDSLTHPETTVTIDNSFTKDMAEAFTVDMEEIIDNGIFGGGTTPSNLKTSKHTINN